MNLHLRRALVLSTLALIAASAACTGSTGDEREGRLASALRKIDPGGDPGPSDPPDPPDHGGGGRPLRDAGVDAAAVTQPTAPPICATRRYFVWRSDAVCTDLTVDGATWVGEPVFPGHASDHCAYRWTGPSLPSATEVEALDGIAYPLFRQRPVVPDCTALPSGCAPGDASCAASLASVAPGRCERIDDDGGCIPGIIISCDSCAVADGDMLYAVIAPDLVSAPALIGQDLLQQTALTFTPPPGAQRFAMPIPPGTLANGTIVTLDVPHP